MNVCLHLKAMDIPPIRASDRIKPEVPQWHKLPS